MNTTNLFRSESGKACRKCLKFKHYEDFPNEKRNKDGKSARCRKCEIKRSGEWAKTKGKEKRKASIKKYQGTKIGKEAKSRANKNYVPKYRKQWPNKYKAHNMVNNAIKSKKLFKEPCEVCGAIESVHAHHDDYLKPLNVRWLCAAHHKQWHDENGEGKNG